MATSLRAVLDAFEYKNTAVSLNQLSRELGVTPAILDSMIDYWVRKGRLREAAPTSCSTCNHARGCPFIMKMPRMIELVRPDDPPPDDPPCACCS